MPIRTKRAYEPAKRSDGLRVLIDRLWPRGLTKRKARIDLWLKEIAPSPKLRTWFGHDPSKWDSFRRRYFRELRRHPGNVARLLEHLGRGTLTLVYSAKDTAHNNAVALKDFVQSRRRRRG